MTLTPAELRVLEAMRTADNERDAARKLGLSPHTVHRHVSSIRSKLAVHSMRQAVLIVFDMAFSGDDGR